MAEEEDTSTDICTQINLLSSIQYQQNELSKLATLLHSEKDREKYIKVIEMSKIIQSRLDDLHEEKSKASNSKRVNHFGQSINKKNSTWSLNQYQSNTNSCCSSSRASYTTDDHTISTISSSNYCGNYYYGNNILSSYMNDESNMIFTADRYHGHTYRIIDRMTSMQFKQINSDSTIVNSRRPSVDTHLIIASDKDRNVIYVKPNTIRKSLHNSKITSRPASPTSIPPLPPIPKHIQEQNDYTSSDEEEEEIVESTAIHVAVRRDASLFKIEKMSNSNTTKESLTSSVTIAATKPSSSPPASSSPLPQPPPLPTTIPIVPKSSFMSSKRNSLLQEKKRVSFSDDKKREHTISLLTPPDSPQSQNQFGAKDESFLDLNNDAPPIIYVQKKTHQSLKGLLKRTYHLNQYTVTKTNSFILPHSADGKLLYKTFNSITGKARFLLKIMIVSLDNNCSKEQKRFGFTFWWQNHYSYHAKNEVEDAKFAVAPDSLVKEALITWIKSQNEVLKKGGVTLLPTLFQSDEILRDGRKLYIVYDTNLFQL